MPESNMPKYVFNGRGNYGGESPSTEELKAAYESAPACHHAAKELSAVAFDSLDRENQIAIEANTAVDEIDFYHGIWDIMEDESRE